MPHIKQSLLNRLNKCCWNCSYQKLGGINLLGKCSWFKEPKEIPTKIVDTGCSKWLNKVKE